MDTQKSYNNEADEQAVIDIDQNCASLKIGKDVYLRILARAVEQTRNDIREFETALPVGDFDKMQKISHRLKGDYDNMRLTHLSSVARAMNDIARQEGDKEQLSVLLKRFKTYFGQLKTALGTS